MDKKEYYRQYREKNREHLREYNRQWLKDNRLKRAKSQLAYWQKTVDELTKEQGGEAIAN